MPEEKVKKQRRLAENLKLRTRHMPTREHKDAKAYKRQQKYKSNYMED